MDREDQGTETEPLLQAGNASVTDGDLRLDLRPHRARIVGLAILIIFLLDFGNFMSLPAQLQLLENIICQQYSAGVEAGNGTVVPGDDLCKSEPVQSELGFIMGWKNTFEDAPGILLAIPYGVLADKWGRKPVLCLSLLGFVLGEAFVRFVVRFSDVVPLRLLWAGSVFSLIGGGSTVAAAVIFTIVSDTFSAMERTNIFFYASASMLISEIFGAPLGAALVEVSHPWLPYMLGLAIEVIGVPFALAIPETLPVLKKIHHMESQTTEDNEVPKPTTLKARLSSMRQTASEIRRLAVENKTLFAIVFAFVVSVLGRHATNFLVLYASKRFHWSLARASYLYSLRSAVNIVLMLLVLPFLTHELITRFRFSANYKDLFLSRLQLIAFLLLGCVLIAFSLDPALFIFGIIWFALGSGFPITMRSLALSLVEPRHFAALNAACSVSQGVGSVIAGPILAAAWHRGLLIGGMGLGLPFIVAAGLFALVAVVLAFIKMEKYSPVEEEEEDEQEAEQRSL